MPEHILSLSYGKDSMACFGACELLGWPLDRIVHAEVWATDAIPADLPPMVEFKAKADRIIKARWGIEVEHVRANRCYQDVFYMTCKSDGDRGGKIYGWPYQRGPWCNSRLKQAALSKIKGIQYIGITADEPARFHSLSDTKKSPIYTTATRGGCWFCHNQGVGQLRQLHKNYPDLWALMLKWDKDSPVTFKADGHTVHDFDRRFKLEDEGLIAADDKIFRWSMLDDELNYRWF